MSNGEVMIVHLIAGLIKKTNGTFYEKELQKNNKQKFRIEKVIKRIRDNLYVKWRGYDSSFNSWIDKKDLIK